MTICWRGRDSSSVSKVNPAGSILVMQRQARAPGITLTIHIDDDIPDVVQINRDKVAWVTSASLK
jgi:hypothetical protein